MRHETHHWYELHFHVELVMGGTPLAGTPEIAIARIFDNKWYSGTASAGFVSNSMIQHSMVAVTHGSTTVPGLYEYKVNVAHCTRPNDEAQDGYLVIIQDTGNAVLEHIKVHITNLPAWAEQRSDYTTAGTFGEGVLVHLCNPDSIVASSIATAAIDADAIATDALGALELGADAASEIATAVWSDNLGNYTTAGKAAFDVHNILLGSFANAGATPNARHEATNTNTAGKVYATTVPTPGTADATALVGLSASLRTAQGGALYKVSAVQNDGGGDYIQLVDSAGSTSIPVDANDFLFVQLSRPNDLTAAGVWDAAVASHTTTGTFGDAVRRILCLRQENMRVVYTAWSATNVPTAGTVYIYDSKADLDADPSGSGTGATGSYSFDATFNGSLQPTMYSSGKLS